MPVPKIFVMVLKDVFIFLLNVRMITYVLVTYVAKIMDVTMLQSAVMIKTYVLLILVIHILDVKTSRSLVTMVMNVPLIDVTVKKVANTSLFLLKITPTVLDGNPKDVQATVTVKTVMLVLKIVAKKANVIL